MKKSGGFYFFEEQTNIRKEERKMIRNIYSWFCWIKKENEALSLQYIFRCMQRQSQPRFAGARIFFLG